MYVHRILVTYDFGNSESPTSDSIDYVTVGSYLSYPKLKWRIFFFFPSTCHRMTWVVRDLKDHPPLQGQLPLDKVAQSPI